MLDHWKQYIEKFNRNDEEIIVQMIPNSGAEEWMEREVPRFECPCKRIEETYYFRWWIFRKHLKQTKEGRIITEFLPDVPWAGAYNSINCANGHHLAEARWLKQDRELPWEYTDFWLRGSGNEYSYSSWIISAVYEQALVSGSRERAVGYLDDLIRFYQRMEETNMTRYGLFWSDDDRDAMERSISGKGLRPTLNSYMYANAEAIAEICGWAGRTETQEKFRAKAENLKERILSLLWDERAQFFKVIPLEEKDGIPESLDFTRISEKHNVREAIGYIPWGMGISGKKYDGAWQFLMDGRYFKTPFGPTTAEKIHPDYNHPARDHECLWNGPVWPYATTQVLNSMIAALQDGGSEYINREHFLELLSAYADSHYRICGDGKRVNWLDENMEPDTGEWLARRILKEWGWRKEKGGYERGKDYNHSAFCDLVIRGICGVRIMKEDILIIDSLLPWGAWDYFMLEDLPCKNHRITVAYDKDGSRYQKGRGLWAEVDGVQRACAEKPEKLVIGL